MYSSSEAGGTWGRGGLDHVSRVNAIDKHACPSLVMTGPFQGLFTSIWLTAPWARVWWIRSGIPSVGPPAGVTSITAPRGRGELSSTTNRIGGTQSLAHTVSTSRIHDR